MIRETLRKLLFGLLAILPAIAAAHPGHYHPPGEDDEFDQFRADWFHLHGWVEVALAATLVASVPFLALAPVLSPWGFTAMLAIGGLLLQSTLPVSVTYAQSITTAGAATVSSLMMGFAWGMGSLAVPLIGLSADRFGINATLVGLSAVSLVAAALAGALPNPAPNSAPLRAAS